MKKETEEKIKKALKKVEKKQIAVNIAPINLRKFTVKIKGKEGSKLLMDKFPERVQKEILDKQTGVSKTSKKIRDLKQEQKDSIHYTHDGKIGFPAGGFKAGMIEATSFVGDKFFSKKLIKGIKILNGPVVPIKFKKQDVLKHNIGSNVKLTPQFHDWSCELELMYDENNISAQDLVILLNYAGFYSGVGIWRPGCKSGGDFGMYEVSLK